MKKLAIFGSTGMLGTYVSKYFSCFYDCVDINRNKIDATFAVSYLSELEDIIKDVDVVVNCVGVLKPYISSTPGNDVVKINTLFPIMLADVCSKHEKKMIHVSSDCVFTGTKGRYIESDVCDANDTYGKTKSLEPYQATTIRTSFVGEQKNARVPGFLQWVLNNKNGTVDGYTNCLWNGVTCLQFCKIIHNIIEQNQFWYGVRHVFSNETFSKYDMCMMVRDVYNIDLEIRECVTDNISGTNVYGVLDRTLSTEYEHIETPPFVEQLIEQKGYL